MRIALKRVYDPASKDDGTRILVDRLWPRGLSKERAKIDLWLKEVAPSTELRQWFNHDPAKWDQLKQRYFAELEEQARAVLSLVEEVSRSKVTLLFAAKNSTQNNAVALREYLIDVKRS